MIKPLLLLLAALSCNLASAEETKPAPAKPAAAKPAATADTAAIKKTLETKYPQLGRIDQVNKAPFLGLYEVVTPDQLVYTDAKAQYLIIGNVFDLKSMRNLSEERSRKLFAVDFNSLPLDLALKKVKGNGKRKMAFFTDPNCSFCKRLEGELAKIDNVTLYMLLYPVFPGSDVKVHNVSCSKDPLKAWEDMMQNGVQPPAAPSTCTASADKVLALGEKLKVSGTPTLIFADGTLIPGFLTAPELEKGLNGIPLR
jgi:thiol:disulfide interchange protein DsbC